MVSRWTRRCRLTGGIPGDEREGGVTGHGYVDVPDRATPAPLMVAEVAFVVRHVTVATLFAPRVAVDLRGRRPRRCRGDDRRGRRRSGPRHFARPA